MFGGSPERNMVNLNARNLPDNWNLEKDINIKWVAELGSRCHGQPVVAGDKVLIGTNNGHPRNPRDRDKPTDDQPDGPPIDLGVLICFRASDGKFLWQAVTDMLESGQVNDWPYQGVCSTPVVDGDRVYYVSNRCEIVCLDLNGFANGNDGFQDEKYQDTTDADIIWSFDMIKQLKVFPHNKAASSPLIAGDLLFVVTGHGVEENHVQVPSPDAPSFVCLNKKTGKLVWKCNLPVGNIMHGQWSSPAHGVIKGKAQVIFPGGDGWLYAFDPPTGKLIWKFDANPKDAKWEIGGRGTRSDFIACPVIYNDRVYIGVGQDPEHLEGVGHYWCIDPTKEGDVSPELVTDATKEPPVTRPNPNNGAIWHYGGPDTRPHSYRDYVFSRTMSTACIVDDVVYIPEMAGYVQCLDARTGKRFWTYDTRSGIWGSCLYADGKVYVGNEDGDVYVFRHDPKPAVFDSPDDAYVRTRTAAEQNAQPGVDAKERVKDARAAGQLAAKKAQRRIEDRVLIRKIELDLPIRSTPSALGDTLYIATESKLIAIAAKPAQLETKP